jgi:hypothetical protein
MAIELSNLTFTEQDDIVSAPRKEEILNTGIANTLAGNDTITGIRGTIYNSGTLNTADGNDLIIGYDDLYNEGIINTGNGDDVIFGGVIYNNGGAIITGDGNDTIFAISPFNSGLDFKSGPNSSGAYFLGEGDDYLHGFGSGDFYGGNGKDIINFSQALGSYTVGIWGEGQDRSVTLTKGNQQMIISQFEWLISVSTGYNVASLIPGQIIDFF